MDEAARPLLDALAARGDAPFLRLDDRVVSGTAMVASIDEARGFNEELPVPLRAGDVVALRGRHPGMRVTAPLAAWSLGLCTNLLGEREPTSSVDGLLAASGARFLLGWSEGRVDPIPLQAHHEVRLPTGTLLHTSGSGGQAKLVVHALRQHVESARGATAFLDLDPEDRLLLSLPTHHVGGLAMLFRAIVSGATLCVPSRGVPLEQALRFHAPTHVSLVATQLARLLRAEETTAALRACRGVLLGGGPLPPRLRAEALAAEIPLIVTYGATETASFVTASADKDVVRRAGTAGRALPNCQVVVSDAGQVLVGGPTLFDGYLIEGKVRTTSVRDGLWATGDLGRLDDGVLHVSGRRDRMFISGGENLQPEEIEMALLGLDGVDEAVVVPVEHEEFGARPVAFVGGTALDAKTLDAALRDLLPGYKTPDVYYRMPARGPARMKPDLKTLTARAGDHLAAATLQRL